MKEKKICIIGVNSDVASNLITHFSKKNIVVNFITFNRDDNMNPSFKNSLNSIITTFIDYTQNVENIIKSSDFIINLSFLPTAEDIGHKFSYKVQKNLDIINFIQEQSNVVTFLPLIKQDKSLFQTRIQSIIDKLNTKKINSIEVHTSPIIDSLVNHIYLAINKFNSLLNLGSSNNLSLSTKQEVIDTSLSIYFNNLVNDKKIILGSVNTFSLNDIQKSIAETLHIKTKKTFIPTCIVKIINIAFKYNIPLFFGSYATMLQKSRPTLQKELKTIENSKININNFIKKYFL